MRLSHVSIVGALLLVASFLVLPAEAGEQRRWYAQQGKGRPLCESLVRIANAHPTKDITPIIPWKESPCDWE